jgi:CheY-like chemotaxis protein
MRWTAVNTDHLEEAPELRILVVDDSPEVRHFLERSLRRLGHDVVLAANGNDGLKVLGEQKFQLAFTDIQMPGMDGHTLLRRIAAQDLDTAVVVISGGGTMDDVVDALRAGAADYLKKPWSGAELVSALGRAEEVYRQRRQARKADQGGATSPPAAARPGPATNPGPLLQFSLLLDQIRGGQIALPSVPAVVSELRQLLAQPKAEVGEIARLIERDPAFSAQILRLSNTAAYARLGANSSVRTALSRIGLRQVENLVETITAHHCYRPRIEALRPLQSHISQHSLARAIAFRALAELLGTASRIDPEVAYMTGLLGDSGASFLLWVVGERSAGTGVLPSEADCLTLVQAHHEEVGGRVLARWSMNPAVILVAQSHHAGSPPAPPSDYWNLAVVGSELAARIGASTDPTRLAAHDQALTERCAADLLIGPTVMRKIEGRVREEFQSVSEALS